MSDKGARALLKSRFGQLFQAGKSEAIKRAPPARRQQKNLTLLEVDVARMKALAARDRISQARLIGRALDAYEEMRGKLGG
ncbi:hypothetical protein ACO2I3_19390 [Leptospira interrogans]